MSLTLTKKLLKKYENEIPDSVKNLQCPNLNLTILPILPTNLKILNISYNNLTKLPPIPPGLKQLYCNHNKLTELPDLPDTLEELHCCNNQIQYLPKLPKNLMTLWCRENQIKRLPTLPDKLDNLVFANNKIIIIPLLPDSLKMMNCDDNPIIRFPDKVPALLQALHYYPDLDYTYIPRVWGDHIWRWHGERHLGIDYQPIMQIIKGIYGSKMRLKRMRFCEELQLGIDEMRYRPGRDGYQELTLANRGRFIDL
jgi:hypothetical protein